MKSPLSAATVKWSACVFWDIKPLSGFPPVRLVYALAFALFPRTKVWSSLTFLPPEEELDLLLDPAGDPLVLSAGRFHQALPRAKSSGLNQRERKGKPPTATAASDFMRNRNYIAWCIYIQLWLSGICGVCLSVCVRAREKQPLCSHVNSVFMSVCISESVTL